MATPSAGIYALAPFSYMNPTPAQKQEIAQAATLLTTAGFDTLLLASFHTNIFGDITFNDTPIVSGGKVIDNLDPELPNYILKMKAGKVKTVLASFGGGGCFHGQGIGFWDFLCIKTLIQQFPDQSTNPFYNNLKVLLDYLHIDGIDIDIEVYAGGCGGEAFGATYLEFEPTILNIINWAKRNNTWTIAAPYEDQLFWAKLLSDAAAANGMRQPIGWYNVQNAAGNSSQGSDFINAIKAVKSGIDDVPGFLSAGLQVYKGMTPAMVYNTFKSYPATQGWRGGWLWNLGDLSDIKLLPVFASAIIQGMTGGSFDEG